MNNLRFCIQSKAQRSCQLFNSIQTGFQSVYQCQTVFTSNIFTNNSIICIAHNLETCALQQNCRMLSVNFFDNQTSSYILEINSLLLPNKNFNLLSYINHSVFIRYKGLSYSVPTGRQVANHDSTSSISAAIKNNQLIALICYSEMTSHQVFACVLVLQDNHQTAVLIIFEITIIILTILNMDCLRTITYLITSRGLSFGYNIEAFSQIGKDCFTISVSF